MTDRVDYGSCSLGEDEFVAAVEETRYPNAEFHHPDHLRLAWVYVRRYGPLEAEERITRTIRRFAASLGHEEKYHETMTRAWLRLVAAAEQLTPNLNSFDDLLAKHAWLLDRSALSAFYSGDCLSNAVARCVWAEPDRRPLPCR